jgi:hypothetical protein
MDDKYKKFLQTPRGSNYHQEEEEEMAISSLLNVVERAGEIISTLEQSPEIPAWVQSKITIAEDYLESVASYLKHKDSVDLIQGDLFEDEC